MNVSAIINIVRLVRDPALCLPHASVPTFNHLPVPVSSVFTNGENGLKSDIRAVVLDKDNCFAYPKENAVYKPYEEKFRALRAAYPGSRLLIVSNSAGTGDDLGGKEAELLERNTGVKVLRHSTKKPGCGSEILAYFRNYPDTPVMKPSQIAIIGDRLFTDVLMGNMMGSPSIWVKNGIVKEKGLFARIERRLARFLFRRGYSPPSLSNPFE